MKIIKYIFPLFTIISIIISCGDDICTSNTKSLLKTEIIVIDTNLINENYLDSLSINTLENADSIINFWEEGEDNSFYFSLTPNDTITTIVFSSKNEALKDTIQIFHQNELFFLSPECGFILNYKINSIGLTNIVYLIDSVHLVQDEITNDTNGHIQIYL